MSTEHLQSWGAQHRAGPTTGEAHSIGLPESSRPGALVFAKTGVEVKNLEQLGILVVTPDFDLSALSLPPHLPVWTTLDFRGVMARALALFDRKIESFPDEIHPSASIAESARLGQNVRVGAHAVIQADAQIGDGAWIGPGAVIEAGAIIGARTRLHSHVVIGYHCEVGRDCEIHANSSLGSDGFGFIPPRQNEPESRPHKIPQVGRVLLGDQVEIGANCAIDRGAIGDTWIGSGTKMDNLCHVAHNCRIGENALIAGGFFIAGSSTIGDRFSCGGNVAVADHVTITHDVTLGGRSAVTKDIEKPGLYSGYPLEPFPEAMRTLASLKELTRLRKEVAELKRRIAAADPS